MAPRSLRQGILRVLVVSAALWPILHMTLVQTRGMSSWKLAGWGMYATPAPAVYYSVRIRPGNDPGSPNKNAWKALDLEALAQYEGAPLPNIFAARRWLGDLVAPDRVAAELLEMQSDAEAVRVIIETRSIDPATGFVVSRRERGQAELP